MSEECWWVLLDSFWALISHKALSHYPVTATNKKLFLFFIHQLMGLLVALSGFYLLLFYGKSSLFFTHRYIILPAVFALVSAAVLVVVGCLGSLLSFRDSIFLQGLVRICLLLSLHALVCGLTMMKCSRVQFVFLLVLVFTLESTASALAFFHSKKVWEKKIHVNWTVCVSVTQQSLHDIICASFCLFSWIQS